MGGGVGWGVGEHGGQPLDTCGKKRRILRGRAAAPASSHGAAARRWGRARFTLPHMLGMTSMIVTLPSPISIFCFCPVARRKVSGG